MANTFPRISNDTKSRGCFTPSISTVFKMILRPDNINTVSCQEELQNWKTNQTFSLFTFSSNSLKLQLVKRHNSDLTQLKWLTRFSTLGRYWKKWEYNGTVHHVFSDSRKPTIQLGRTLQFGIARNLVLWNLVSNIKGRAQTEGVWGQGTEGNIWT
jgi:hypothetical protein